MIVGVDEVRALRDTFDQMRSMMEEDKDRSWIGHFDHMIAVLDASISSNSEFSSAVSRVFREYQNINRGYGSFSDYYIQKKSKSELVKENKKFDELKAHAFSIMNNGIG